MLSLNYPPSYTIDALTYLKEKYPQHQFTIIMGSDSFQNLPRWKNYELLLKNYAFIIYRRPGYEIKRKLCGPN
jgi:nicotinate-nucleotide adenylyltransferase